MLKVKIKVTAIKCPSCKGNGLFMNEPGIACMWCKGAKKLKRKDAIHYANQVWMIAGGGYIAGDHNLEDMRIMEAESAKIRALFDLTPLKSK